jgi:opacity protein-like surface antigen
LLVGKAMRILFVISAAVIGCAGPTAAESIFAVPEVLPSTTFQLRPYVGAGASWTHHTGYERDRPAVHLEQWEPSGKAFAGVWYAKRAAVEAAYHFLNSSPFRSVAGGRMPGKETSDAVAVSLLMFTPPLFANWLSSNEYVLRLYARGGGAYKWISDDNGAGLIQRESGLSYLIGGGAQLEIGQSWFARIEYEYISKVGTERAVDVQHTPISISIGYRPHMP